MISHFRSWGQLGAPSVALEGNNRPVVMQRFRVFALVTAWRAWRFSPKMTPILFWCSGVAFSPLGSLALLWSRLGAPGLPLGPLGSPRFGPQGAYLVDLFESSLELPFGPWGPTSASSGSTSPLWVPSRSPLPSPGGVLARLGDPLAFLWALGRPFAVAQTCVSAVRHLAARTKCCSCFPKTVWANTHCV